MPQTPTPSRASTTTPFPVRAPRHDRAQTPTVPVCSAPYRWLPSLAYNWISAIPGGAGRVHPEAHRRQDRTIVRRRWNADGYKSLTGPSHVVFFRCSKNPRKACNNNNIRSWFERSCRISLRTLRTRNDASQGVRYGLPSHLAEQILPGRAGCNFGAGSRIRHIADLRMKLRDRRCAANRELGLPAETWGQRAYGTGPCRSVPLYREPRPKRALHEEEVHRFVYVLSAEGANDPRHDSDRRLSSVWTKYADALRTIPIAVCNSRISPSNTPRRSRLILASHAHEPSRPIACSTQARNVSIEQPNLPEIVPIGVNCQSSSGPRSSTIRPPSSRRQPMGAVANVEDLFAIQHPNQARAGDYIRTRIISSQCA